MTTLFQDPEDFCPVCDHRFGFSDERCEYCDFDPVGNDNDAEAYEIYIAEWKEQHEQSEVAQRNTPA
jgi:hypothetical protein